MLASPAVHVLIKTAAVVLVVVCSGCQTVSFYSQAIGGQIEIWRKQRPIDSLLNDPSTSESLRQKLQLVLSLRSFAETNLGLPARGQYLSYADLQRRFVVWNVYAAPEFSLTPKSWWYPIVGKLDYRGYFSEGDARAQAARVRAKGFDVHTGGVTAYSTLGWFRDPVLNTFIHESEAELAELVFHELAHQRLFFPHDTEFNEGFATAVAQEGTRRWLRARGKGPAAADYDRSLHEMEEFMVQLSAARDRLNNLYTNLPPSLTVSEVSESRRRKADILNELRRWSKAHPRLEAESVRFTKWLEQDLNNALLNTVETYHRLVPAFRQHLKARAGNDLSQFYRDMETLKKQTKAGRRTYLAGPTPQRRLIEGPIRQIAPTPSDERPAIRESRRASSPPPPPSHDATE